MRSFIYSIFTGVLKPRDVSDLQSTRDQIMRCFEGIDCYLLPHPGSAVTKKTFSGLVSQIDPFFRSLIDKYVREVFEERLEAKCINDRLVSGSDMMTYFQVYVRTFQTSCRGFPKAMTLLGKSYTQI